MSNHRSRTAYDRFVASMTMDYEKWHDGIGYDLAAIDEMEPAERAAVEKLILSRDGRDWMEIDTLAYLDSPGARAELQRLAKAGDAATRLRAARALGSGSDADDREKAIIDGLRSEHLSTWSRAVDMAAECRTPAVLDALYDAARKGDGNLAVHAAAMIFYLAGIAQEPFDWDHRPFFLRFNTEDKAERRKAYEELCSRTRR